MSGATMTRIVLPAVAASFLRVSPYCCSSVYEIIFLLLHIEVGTTIFSRFRRGGGRREEG